MTAPAPARPTRPHTRAACRHARRAVGGGQPAPAGHRQVPDGPLGVRCGQGRCRGGHHRLPGHAHPAAGRPAAGAREDRLRLHRRRHGQARHLPGHPAAHVVGPGLQPGLEARRPHRAAGRRARPRSTAESKDGDLLGPRRRPRQEGEGVHTYDFSYTIRRRLPRPERPHRARLERDRDVVAGADRVGVGLDRPGRCRPGRRSPASTERSEANKPCATSGTRYTAEQRAAVPGHDRRLRLPGRQHRRHRTDPRAQADAVVGLPRPRIGRWRLARCSRLGGTRLLSFLRWWRHGRDESYEGQIPGLVPPRPVRGSWSSAGGPGRPRCSSPRRPTRVRPNSRSW